MEKRRLACFLVIAARRARDKEDFALLADAILPDTIDREKALLYYERLRTVQEPEKKPKKKRSLAAVPAPRREEPAPASGPEIPEPGATAEPSPPRAEAKPKAPRKPRSRSRPEPVPLAAPEPIVITPYDRARLALEEFTPDLERGEAVLAAARDRVARLEHEVASIEKDLDDQWTDALRMAAEAYGADGEEFSVNTLRPLAPPGRDHLPGLVIRSLRRDLEPVGWEKAISSARKGGRTRTWRFRTGTVAPEGTP